MRCHFPHFYLLFSMFMQKFIIHSFLIIWWMLFLIMSQKLRLHFDTQNQMPVHVCICSSADAGGIRWVRVAQSRAFTTCQVFGLENVVMRFYWHRFTADELINYVNLLLNYYYTNGSVTVISDYNFTWNLRHARLPARNPRADHTHTDIPSIQQWHSLRCSRLTTHLPT